MRPVRLTSVAPSVKVKVSLSLEPTSLSMVLPKCVTRSGALPSATFTSVAEMVKRRRLVKLVKFNSSSEPPESYTATKPEFG